MKPQKILMAQKMLVTIPSVTVTVSPVGVVNVPVAPVEMTSLHDDHGPSQPETGPRGIGEFNPPDLALPDLYHSLRSRIRREAALTTESVLSGSWSRA
jgi:hypothetical protein